MVTEIIARDLSTATNDAIVIREEASGAGLSTWAFGGSLRRKKSIALTIHIAAVTKNAPRIKKPAASSIEAKTGDNPNPAITKTDRSVKN